MHGGKWICIVIPGRTRMLSFYFIYTPIFTLSLESDRRRTKSRAIHTPYHPVPYLAIRNIIHPPVAIIPVAYEWKRRAPAPHTWRQEKQRS